MPKSTLVSFDLSDIANHGESAGLSCNAALALSARQKIVGILVDDKLSQLVNDIDFARHVLTSGFAGFSNMSASQLNCLVCDAGLDLREGMELLLHELTQSESLVARSAVLSNGQRLSLPVDNVDLRTALANEIRYFFQNEASPTLVQVMLETLGTQATSVRAEDNFNGLHELTADQLRRLVPVTLAVREHVRDLLARLEAAA